MKIGFDGVIRHMHVCFVNINRNIEIDLENIFWGETKYVVNMGVSGYLHFQLYFFAIKAVN